MLSSRSCLPSARVSVLVIICLTARTISAVASNKQFATLAVAWNARRLTISLLGPQNLLLLLKLIMLLTTNAAEGELMSC